MKSFEEEESCEMAQVLPMSFNEDFELPNLVQTLVDGKVRLMPEATFEQYVSDAVKEEYQKFLEDGDEGTPIKAVFSELRKKHGLSDI